MSLIPKWAGFGVRLYLLPVMIVGVLLAVVFGLSVLALLVQVLEGLIS